MDIAFIAIGALISPVFLVISLIFGVIGKKKEAKDFSLARYFPSEAFSAKGPYGAFPYMCLALAFVGFLFPGIALLSFLDEADSSLKAFLSFVLALEGISSCVLLSLMSFHPSREKPHMASYVGAITCLMLSDGVFGTALLAMRGIAEEGITIAFASILFVLAAACLPLLFDKRIADWARLEAHSEIDGSVTYHRPKVIWFAAWEWLLLLGYLVSFLVSSGMAIYLIMAA